MLTKKHVCANAHIQGTARRKKKVVHRTATADDKKLQFSLKKLGVNNISGIEEVGHKSLLSYSFACDFFLHAPVQIVIFITKNGKSVLIGSRSTCLQIKEQSSISTIPKCRPPSQPTPSPSPATLRPNSWLRCCQASWTSWEQTAWRASGDSPRLCPSKVGSLKL